MANNGTGQPLHQLSFLAESHEDRLQKVEENLSDVAVAIGKMETSQQYMVEQQDSSSKAILDKLSGIVTKFDSFESRLTPIEAEQSKRDVRKTHVRTIIKGAIAALGGAIAAGAGTWIWDLISK